MALGATIPASIVGAREETAEVTVDNPAVVTTNRLDSNALELRGVGVGKARIAIQQSGWSVEYAIEVAEPTRFETALVSGNLFASQGTPNGKTLLSDVDQYIVVTHHDEEGILLGQGLADFTPLGDDCNYLAGWDARCWRPSDGSELIRLEVGGETRFIRVNAVSERDIVDLFVAHASEEHAAPGHLIRVAAFGITEDGTVVSGVHASSFGEWVALPFEYEFDPSAEPVSITVTAAGIDKSLTIRSAGLQAKAFWEESVTD